MNANDDPPVENSVLADAEDLFDLDPARAELWVSGLLADLDVEETRRLLEMLEAEVAASSPAIGVAQLLAGVISVVADPEVATRAATICHPAELSVPAWASVLGTATPVDAMAVEVDGFRSSLIIRFEHRGGERHLMLVELDPAAGVITDLRFAPDGLFDDELDDEEIELIPEELEGLGVQLAAALEPADLATPSIALNRLVARRRIGALGAEVAEHDRSDVAPSVLDDPDPISAEDGIDRDEEDAAAVELLESALAKQLAAGGPSQQAIAKVAEVIRSGLSGNADADVASVCAAAGVLGDEDDIQLVHGFLAAYAAPKRLDPFTIDEQEGIRHLEWADWLGAVIGLVRGGEGTLVTPHGMVKAINRCPEITTTIPKADADYVAWSFELTLHAWSIGGVVDDEERLTSFGASVLPQAFRAVWAR